MVEALKAKENQMDMIPPPRFDAPLTSIPRGSLIETVGDLGLALSRATTDNQLSSPFSIIDAWLRVWAGARDQTRVELDALFGIRDDSAVREALASIGRALQDASGERCVVRSASTLWMRPGYRLDQGFLERWADSAKTLDFSNPKEAANTINQWVDDHTDGMIVDLVSERSISPEMALVIANAIFLDADWSAQFSDAYFTKDRPFTLANGDVVEVPTMVHQSQYRCVQHASFTLLEKPYVNPNLRFVVLLPNVGALDEVTEKLRWGTVESAMDACALTDTVVRLPKFKMEASPDVDELFRSSGLLSVYKPSTSNLSGITPDALKPGEELCVGQTIHRAKIDVNESGTRAAAATAIMAPAGAAFVERPPPFEFFVDRPFFFFIVERTTNTPLFSGRMMDPR